MNLKSQILCLHIIMFTQRKYFVGRWLRWTFRARSENFFGHLWSIFIVLSANILYERVDAYRSRRCRGLLDLIQNFLTPPHVGRSVKHSTLSIHPFILRNPLLNISCTHLLSESNEPMSYQFSLFIMFPFLFNSFLFNLFKFVRYFNIYFWLVNVFFFSLDI